MTHLDPLHWATEGSAACIGRPELDRIAPGTGADLACFTLDELRFSGHGDPIADIVMCGAHRANRVMVAGRWTVWDGAILDLGIAALRRDQQRAAMRVQAA